MKRARELVIAMSNRDFKHFSPPLLQLHPKLQKEHSLRKALPSWQGSECCDITSPWVGVEKFIANAPWSSANVNFTVDASAANEKMCVVDAKNAKSIDPGDIPPVQKPMKTWEQTWGILPDHNWETGTTNAVTPMAHLFLESKVILKDIDSLPI